MPTPLPFRSFRQIHDAPIAPPKVAIEGLCHTDDLVIVTGGWDSFKSTFGAELAWSLASGDPFLGHFEVRQTLKMGIIQVEIHPGSYDERVNIAHPTRERAHDNILVASIPGWTLTDYDGLVDAIDELDLEGIILDPVGRMWPARSPGGYSDFNENANEHVSPLLSSLKILGRLVVIIHHDPKDQQGFKGRARGSSALLNDPDVRIMLDREEGDEEVSNVVKVRVRNRLQKPAKPFKALFSKGRLRAGMGGRKQSHNKEAR